MWIVVATALAQVADGDAPEVDVQLFRPSLDARHTLWLDDARRHENHAILGRFVVHYAKDPLVYVDEDGVATKVLSDIVQLDAMAGYQLGPIRAGLVVPLYLYTDGANRQSEAGIGDIGLDVKATILDPEEKGAGLAVVGRLGLPTSNLQGAPLTSGGATWELTGVVDGDVGERGFILGNLGVVGVPKVELENLTWGTRVLARVGAGVRTSPTSGFAGEIVGSGIPGSPLDAGVPVEGMLSGWVQSAPGLTLRGGVGGGFTPGIGAPALRVVFAVSLGPDTTKDTDGDGISDLLDACPDVPEDVDGVDDTDGCPDPTKITVTIQNADGVALPEGTFLIVGTEVKGSNGATFELAAGEHAFVVSAPGHVEQKATRTTSEGPDAGLVFRLDKVILPGVLAPKISGPGGAVVPGAVWSVVGADGPSYTADQTAELKPGSYQITVGAPGYRPAFARAEIAEGARVEVPVQLAPAKAVIERDRITIQESVFFDLAKATIQPVSFNLLDEVGELLVAHPEIKKLRIEGHTDDQGAADYNKKLSQDRAESVKAYFVSKGVPAERLEAVGFGEERPLIPKKTTDARAKNRRVDFFVAERAEEAPPTPQP